MAISKWGYISCNSSVEEGQKFVIGIANQFLHKKLTNLE